MWVTIDTVSLFNREITNVLSLTGAHRGVAQGTN